MMKNLLMTILATLSLVACSTPNASVQTTDNTVTVPLVTDTAPIQSAGNIAEETEIRDLVENFGKRLQLISLLSPRAAQDIQQKYAEFVSPALLEMWMNDVSSAPGRMASSPWPDHIEITALTKKGSDKYVITGFVIEMTSVELVNGGAAAKIPVRVVVQNDQGRWLITEYAEKR